eukprot:363514-Chlamydomonas_euryale.AAC.8
MEGWRPDNRPFRSADGVRATSDGTHTCGGQRWFACTCAQTCMPGLGSIRTAACQLEVTAGRVAPAGRAQDVSDARQSHSGRPSCLATMATHRPVALQCRSARFSSRHGFTIC